MTDVKQNPLVAAISAPSLISSKRSEVAEELPILEDGLTVDELAAQLNRGEDWVRTRLRALAAEGRLIIGKRKVLDLAGREIMVPCYKIRESA